MSNLLYLKHDVEHVSDGFHTFKELYAHRILLFAAVCALSPASQCWRSLVHADGTCYENWFIAGMTLQTGDITYHIPLEHWALFASATTLAKAPPWDGHTSHAVERGLEAWVRQMLATPPVTP